jgi:F0F1-type ATP synthase delta subunit
MKKAQIYAEVLHGYFKDHSEQEQSDFFEKFKAFLESKKELQLLPAILKEVESIIARDTKEGVTLIVRDETDAERYGKELDQHADNFDISNITTEIDETIVGGYILKSATNMVDNSYKTQLINMYQQLVS